MMFRRLCYTSYLILSLTCLIAQEKNEFNETAFAEVAFNIVNTLGNEFQFQISEEDKLNFDGRHQYLSLSLPYGSKMNKVIVEKNPLFPNDFKIVLSTGVELVKPKSLEVYYGKSLNEEVQVYLTVYKQEAHIVLFGSKGSFEIIPSTNDSYRGYFSNNLKSKSFDCYTPDDEALFSTKVNPSTKSMFGDCLELYLEVDHTAYLDLGSSTSNVMTWVSTIINPVARYLERSNINVVLSEVFIWTSPDPFTSTNTLSVLNEFKSTRLNNYNGRIAQLLSTRDIGGGISDGIGGFCQSYPSSPGPFAVCGNLESSISGLPNFNFSVNLVAHELGHVLGARHTHACVWNGNNTAIDDCGNVYATQQGNFPEGAPCYDVNNPIPDPVGGGSIMSRCDLLNIGVNLSEGYHPQVSQVISDNYLNATCQTGVVCASVRPSNNDCLGAIPLQVKNTCIPDIYDNYLANASGTNPDFTCGTPGTTDDVWFSVEVPTSGDLTIETTNLAGGLMDMIIQVYTGTCQNLTTVSCDDNSGASNHARVDLISRTPGEILFIRVVDTGSNDEGIFGLCVYDVSIPCHPQISDLVSFYNATGGGSWTNRLGWEQGAQGLDCEVCTWYGVTCNQNDEVTRIQLADNNLVGAMPSIITTFEKLELLDLGENSLSNTLPANMGLMDSLIFLDLSLNNMSGALSNDFANMDKLAVLYLQANNFSGDIPSNLGDTDFNILHLQNNNLSGCIPPSINNPLPNKDVDLSGNTSLSNDNFDLFCSDGLGGDVDGDGFCAGSGTNEDCLDNNPLSFPGAMEVCDGLDNDCNGITDDGVAQTNTYVGPFLGDWNVMSSWSLNQVPEPCHDVVITDTEVNIQIPTLARARSVQLNGMAVLTNAGGLSVQGSPTDGIQVNGMSLFTNDGTVTIDDVIQTGLNIEGMTNNNDSLVVKENVGTAVRIQANASFQNAMNAILNLGGQ